MGAKVRFISLLIVLILLTSLLMNSHEFSTPHKKNPVAGDILTLIMSVLYLGGLILILLTTYYYYDRFAQKRREYQASYADLISVFLYLILLPLFGLFFGRGSIRVSSVNETAPGPLVASNRTFHGVITPLSPLRTHLYIFALIPIIIGVSYISYYYLRLALKEAEKKKKVKMAASFDKKLDELGLEQFSDPKEAVVQIYKNAVLWLEGLGIPYQESWTHWEHAEHVNYMRSLYLKLVKLFEKAKYAPERVEWKDAEKAFEIYLELRWKAREVAGIA
ncbi:DUF4129 domain-containing protein [Thermococcus stetteri]|uniref:DUF4129 domain-containing protein n=1 Tax=Thermococcus stetteri TaxID=49900 RepID=UPI001AE5404A|nr:DUF4129 domain-containing protein [Thermococcus stetteri]MBP1911534.1 hypothetical protein [Thermococcus stetteri]